MFMGISFLSNLLGQNYFSSIPCSEIDKHVEIHSMVALGFTLLAFGVVSFGLFYCGAFFGSCLIIQLYGLRKIDQTYNLKHV